MRFIRSWDLIVADTDATEIIVVPTPSSFVQEIDHTLFTYMWLVSFTIFFFVSVLMFVGFVILRKWDKLSSFPVFNCCIGEVCASVMFCRNGWSTNTVASETTAIYSIANDTRCPENDESYELMSLDSSALLESVA